MLFVDVSGFTALTERLAARGKVGAEEITDVIANVFHELLGVGGSYGADLLKWGGDAALLFFSGADSAPRACRAAVLMSRTMPRIGRLKTSAGRVDLGVSIGGHSGLFDFYLFGDSHRELVVTGPAASATARMEATAESGEVLVSTDVVERLRQLGCLGDGGDGRSVLGQGKQEGILLHEAPPALEMPQCDRPPPLESEIALLLPPEIRRHLLGGGEQAEHRQATIAFVAFSGVDVLSEKEGPEAVTSVLEPVVLAAQEAAQQFGVCLYGTDIAADGGKLIFLGGIPVARGNDATRVLSAVHDTVAGHAPDSPVTLRAGVNSGRLFVFSQAIGLGERHIFSVTGDAANLAARVMGHARATQVLATHGTLVRAKHPFATEPIPPFSVKGKSEPVVASIVGDPRHTTVEEEREDGAFVGRTEELERILTEAVTAAQGSGGVVEIIGPPGIGKSRIVSEAINRWELTTLRIGCEEYASATPYLPFRRVLRRLLGLREDSPAEVVADQLRRSVTERVPELEAFLPLLADVVGTTVPSTVAVEELEGRFRRARLEHCVAGLIASFITGPAALVFDDTHAMDEASASLLAVLAARLGALPLLLVLTLRPGRPLRLPESCRRLQVLLEPLGPSSASRLASMAGLRLSPVQLSKLVARAAGNPLFLRELVRAAAEPGALDELPESIEPLLTRDIDLLSPVDRRVLRTAAVLGGHFDPYLLREVLDEDVVLGDEVWERLGSFVVPTATGWRFAHDLIRDAAYEGLAFRRRRELHARAARAIEARAGEPEEAASLLSVHWWHAEDFERAWRFSRLAGDRARALWANSDAVVLLERALSAARRLRRLPAPEVADVAEALGDVCELSGDFDRARHGYLQARRLVRTPADRARLLRKVGVLHERQGRYRQALAAYSRGRGLVSSAEAGAATERVELDLASAGIRSRQGKPRDCRRFAAAAGAEAARAGYRSGLAHALYLQHLSSLEMGEPDDELAAGALATFGELGDLLGQAKVLNNLGIGAYYRGRWTESRRYYEQSREARARAGDVIGACTAENNIGEILSDQGLLEAARGLLESALATWRAAGYRVGTAIATSNLGRLEARAGDLDAGRRLLASAVEEFDAIGSPVYGGEAEVRLVECEVLAGNFSAALGAADELRRRVRHRPRLEEAAVASLRLASVSRAFSCEEDVRHLGRLGLDAAVAEAEALDAPYELALCRATRAAACELNGESGQVAADRAAAAEIFDRLGVARAIITWRHPRSGLPVYACGGETPRKESPRPQDVTVTATAETQDIAQATTAW